VVITGANRGGKSTFLRAVGLAQLMMQSGMFVAANEYVAAVRVGVFTHFPRAEDPTMTHGKFAEELTRLSGIVDRAGPTSLLLFNEAFASTNEREGAEIARQAIAALLDAGLRVVAVTHIVALARAWQASEPGRAAFLRADPDPDGGRSFRLVAGGPLPTGHAEDLYRQLFGTS
jgi:DNA mismatch repair ATPase MutS